jgi:hypothetical protein
MPGSAAKVVITERQQAILRKLSTASTAAKRLVQRATIILLAFAGLSNQDIAAQVGLGRHQIGLWRRRWQYAFDDLVRIACTEVTVVPPTLQVSSRTPRKPDVAHRHTVAGLTGRSFRRRGRRRAAWARVRGSSAKRSMVIANPLEEYGPLQEDGHSRRGG